VLEAHCRKYLIDPMLEALGWELSNPNEVFVEEGVDDTISGAPRRFLDYHGRAEVLSGSASLILIEAKRLSARLPRLRNPNAGRTQGVSSAIQRILQVTATRSEATTAPAADMDHEANWREWLGTLRDYLERMGQARAGLPRVAVVTNGIWYVFFKAPLQLLGRETAVEESIIVFESLDDILNDLRLFHRLLGRAALSEGTGPQTPEAIVRFVKAGDRPRLMVAILALWGRSGPVQPSLVLRPVVVMPRDGAPPLRFQLSLQRPYLELHDDPELMALVLARLGEQLDQLRGRCDEVAGPEGCEWLSLTDYRQLWPGGSLGFDVGEEGSLILTGGPVSFLLDDSTFDGCPFHTWSACRAEGRAATLQPVASSSSDPPSFFDDGSPRHCVHSTVRERKDQRCLIPEDRHICCRRCIYFTHCWNGDDHVLPCSRGTEPAACG
jgi:hypothetical protein